MKFCFRLTGIVLIVVFLFLGLTSLCTGENGYRDFLRNCVRQIVQGRFDEAKQIMEKKKTETDVIRDSKYEASFLLLDGLLLYYDKKSGDSAEGCWKNAYEIFKKEKDDWGRAFVLMRWGVYCLEKKDLKRSLLMLENCPGLFEKEKDYSQAAVANVQLFNLYCEENRESVAEGFIKAAIRDYELAGDNLRMGGAYSIWSKLYFDKSDYDKALSLQEKAVESAVKADNKDILAKMYIQYANILSCLGKDNDSLQYLDKAGALDISEETHAWIYYVRGNTLFALSRWNEAVLDYNKACSIYENKGKFSDAADTYYHIGNTYYYEGSVEKAIEALIKSLNLYLEISDRSGEAAVRRLIGDIYISSGDTKKGFDEYSKSAAILKSLNKPLAYAGLIAYLGVQHYFSGDWKKGEGLLKEAIDILKKVDGKTLQPDLVYALTSIGNVYTSSGDYKKAKQSVDEAIKISRSFNYKEGILSGLDALSNLYYQLGNPGKMQEVLQESLKLACSGSDRPRKALVLSGLGFCSEQLGNFDEALKYYEESLKINSECGYRKAMANDHINLGYFAYCYEPDTKLAEEHYQKALELYAEIKDYCGMITALEFLGNLYKNRSIPEKAFDYYNRAIALCREKGFKEREQSVGFYINYYRFLLGDINEGLKQIENCAKYYRERNMLSIFAEYKMFLCSINLVNLGDINGAEKHLKEAEAVYGSLGDRKGLCHCKMMNAKIDAERCSFDEAVKNYSMVINESEKYGYNNIYIQSLTELAMLYSSGYRNPEKSLDCYTKAIDACEKYGFRNMQVLLLVSASDVCISFSELRKGYSKKARELLAGAQKISEKLENPLLNGNIYLNLAKLSYIDEEYEEAENLLKKAKAFSKYDNNLLVDIDLMLVYVYISGKKNERVNDIIDELQSVLISKVPNVRYRSHILNLLIQVYMNLGDYRSALSKIKDKIEFDRNHYTQVFLYDDYICAGVVSEKLGDRVSAVDYYEKAISAGEEITGSFKSEESYLDFTKNIQDKISPYGRLIDFSIQKGEYEKAYSLSERDRARAFLISVGGNTWPKIPEDRVNDRIVKTIKDMKEYSGLFSAIQGSLGSSNDSLFAMRLTSPGIPKGLSSPDSKDSQDRGLAMKRDESFLGKTDPNSLFTMNIPPEYMEQYKKKYMETVALMKMEYPDYYNLKSVSPAKLSEIRKLIDDDSLMIEYYMENDKFFVFLIGKEIFKVLCVPVKYSEIEKKITAFREDIKNTITGQIRDFSLESKERAADLYEIFFLPLEKYLRGKKRLILVPHRDLHNLPFAALVDKTGLPVICSYSIVYFPSASALPLCREKAVKKEGGNSFVGFALGNVTYENYSELPGTIDETKAIKELFPGSEIRCEKDFTKEQVVRLSPKGKYVHFATHGILDDSYPYFSGILTQDGIFRINDIFSSLTLPCCTLATISACQTALGTITTGDDMIGVSRALFYAGAPTVVASLWSVADESTMKLMKYFYKSLRDGLEKDKALQSAQIKLMKEYPQPYHWASFIIIGDWEIFETKLEKK